MKTESYLPIKINPYCGQCKWEITLDGGSYCELVMHHNNERLWQTATQRSEHGACKPWGVWFKERKEG